MSDAITRPTIYREQKISPVIEWTGHIKAHLDTQYQMVTKLGLTIKQCKTIGQKTDTICGYVFQSKCCKELILCSQLNNQSHVHSATCGTCGKELKKNQRSSNMGLVLKTLINNNRLGYPALTTAQLQFLTGMKKSSLRNIVINMELDEYVTIHDDLLDLRKKSIVVDHLKLLMILDEVDYTERVNTIRQANMPAYCNICTGKCFKNSRGLKIHQTKSLAHFKLKLDLADPNRLTLADFFSEES